MRKAVPQETRNSHATPKRATIYSSFFASAAGDTPTRFMYLTA
jgi:hypothetical protein